MKSRRVRLATALLLSGLIVLVCGTLPAIGSQIRQSAQQLTEQAQVILTATVAATTAYEKDDARGHHIYTTVTVRPQTFLKGTLADTEVRFDVVGGTLQGRTEMVSFSPTFQQGEEVLLFMGSQAGQPLSLVAANQGKRTIIDGRIWIDDQWVRVSDFAAAVQRFVANPQGGLVIPRESLMTPQAGAQVPTISGAGQTSVSGVTKAAQAAGPQLQMRAIGQLPPDAIRNMPKAPVQANPIMVGSGQLPEALATRGAPKQVTPAQVIVLSGGQVPAGAVRPQRSAPAPVPPTVTGFGQLPAGRGRSEEKAPQPTTTNIVSATIWDAWWQNPVDMDGDGYVRSADLCWDPDVSGSTGSLVVFEKIYWKPASSGSWTLLATTTTHTITGASSGDAVYVSITGGSHNLYDWKIEVYRSGMGTPDYARSDANDANLNDYPMETTSEDTVSTTATIYDAWWSNPTDADSDGYKRSAYLNWDPDVVGSTGSLSVFEKIYWKLSTSSTWTLALTTSTHTITGASTGDAQYVNVSGGSHGLYDFKIEVYRSGQSGADYARSDANDADLNDYPMEATDEDSPATATIYDAWWSNPVDTDGDGYRTSARLNWDPDVSGSTGSLSVFERVYWKLSTSSTWTLLATTSSHTITGTSTGDAQYMDISGGSHGLYDWKIEVYRSGQSSADYVRSDANDGDLNDYPMETTAEDSVSATIYDAWWSNQIDADHDGYKESAQLNWDPDVAGSTGSLSVFEKIYWKVSTSSTWTLGLTTSPHTITGATTSDAQAVGITVTGPPALFDFKIEIYRSGQGTPDYVRSDANDGDLNDYAMASGAVFATIYDASWTNPVDLDNDGYKRSARLNWDPDVVGSTGSLSVFEKVYWKFSTSSSWTLLTTTSNHTINGTSTADIQYLDILGGSHALYDWKIEIYRAGQSTVDYTRSDTNDGDLNDYPMETAAEDPPTSGAPAIAGISPGIASAGTNTQVTISGSNFGPTQGTSKVQFYYLSTTSKIDASIVSWSDTSITAVVPVGTIDGYAASAGSGPVTVTTTGGTSNPYTFRVRFSYMGVYWPSSAVASGIGYLMNENLSTVTGEGAAFDRAAGTWGASGAAFSFRNAGTHTHTTASGNGANEIMWGNLGDASIIAGTYSWSSGGFMTEADIVFNTQQSWSTSSTPSSSAYDVESIALHELGHWLSLRDIYGDAGDGEYDSAKVMYGFGSLGQSKRALHADDRAGIIWIYGQQTTHAVIRDAWWSDQVDADLDGYKRSATLNWDPDVSGGSGPLSVFEKIYRRQTGTSTWTLVTTTSTHTITGTGTTDQQVLPVSVPAHALYDFKIEVYRASTSSPDDARDPTSDQDLNSYAMEPAGEDITVPGPFNKTAPANGSTGQSTTVTLSWAANSAATSYDVCVTTTLGSSCSGSWTNVGNTTMKTQNDLLPGTTYYWQVRAVNSVGTTYADSNTWWNFTTQGGAPGQFNKTTPSNAATGQPTSVTLSWGASSGATSYQYCIDTSNDSACGTSWVSVTGTSVPISGLTAGTTYYWHVRATNAYGTTYANGDSNAWWSFATQPPQLGSFGKTAPANGASSQPASVTLSWGASSGATGYQYCYDTTNDGACTGSWTSVTATSATVSSLGTNTTYYWQVRATNGANNLDADGGTWWSFSTGGAAPGTATRTLPGHYGSGAVPVSILVVPQATVSVWAVEETPPTGWTVSSISDGGSWDNTNKKVKWGPYFDNTTRTLTYQTMPPSGTTGVKTFTGQASFDGSSIAIGGMSSIDSAAPHPADANVDMRIIIDECTAYGLAWKTGATWPIAPNPIPMDYATRACYLWKSGEVYTNAGGDPPNCWVPATSGIVTGSSTPSGSTATSSMNATYQPGAAMTITLSVTPASSTLSWAIEDSPPAGWTVSSISSGGTWDSTNRKVKWGPFFDAGARTLTYAATPPSGETGTQAFSGTASFDGTSVPITGVRTVSRRTIGYDFNADGKPDLVWRNRITGDVIFWLMDGTTTTSEIHMAGPTDRNAKIVAIADFNNDGNPDLVFRSQSTGADQIWFMNGTTHTTSADLPAVADQHWTVGAAIDFNADGQPDLLWRNAATGDVVVWYMNGATYAGYAWVSSIADTNWQIGLCEDFNADGKPDIVWRNETTGQNLVWYMNGASYSNFAWLATEAVNWTVAGVVDADGDGAPDLVWHDQATGANKVDYAAGGSAALADMSDVDVEPVGATAGRTNGTLKDFNANRWSDILWHDTATGDNHIWYMYRATRRADVALASEPDIDWRPVGVADFNGDGMPDIVWRNASTGANRIWLMTGRSHTGDMTLPTIADSNWKIVGIGDFNQDGHPDLVWRNYSTGANIIWFLHNGVYYDWTAPPTIADTNWEIVAVGDFNGDGWPDLFWRNQTTGVNIAWFLVRGVYSGWGQPPTIDDTTWQIVDAADFNGDGKADLLWRNATTGQNLVWYLNNGSYIGFDWLPTLDIAWKTGARQ